ncbi:MAG: hypothetical protein HY674_21825 [Chloroflexi bacterium]|nr:hypothetical protein [Chloroflexota bacterium]
MTLLTLLTLLTLSAALAYPPAPHHLLYGQVRDEMGNPILMNSATVFLETSAGARIKTQIIPGLGAGVNYELPIPMDSGLTADNYKANALRPTVPFKMWVLLNGVTYRPIEMRGDYSQLGQPSATTRLDLTLGEDANGNGLPDAWERAMLAAAGQNLPALNPNEDLDGDGLSNLNEYIAGTYAFDPQDGFALKIVGLSNGTPILEFLSIRGRTYTVLGSQDMVHWWPVAFRTAGANGLLLSEYYASDVRTLRLEAPPAEPEAPAFKFFKLMVR